MIITKIGNLFDSTAPVIVHQVNCLGIMGAGLALQIKRKFPNTYKDYKTYCESKNIEELIGTCLLSEINPGEKKYIAHLFGQVKISTMGEQTTNYTAFEMACSLLSRELDKLKISHIAIPKNIGCGLARGDWGIIYPIIIRTLNKSDRTIEIIELRR